MALNIIGILLFATGGGVMILTAFSYYRLLGYYREEIYESLKTGYRVNQLLLFLIIFGFFLGILEMTLVQIDSRFLAASAGFTLLSVFIYFLVKTQAAAAVALREKALEAIRAFVNTIDTKEYYAQGHSQSVYHIVNLFYDQLQEYHFFLHKIKLLDAAILHDIGKINIPAEVFSKREKLTAEDWALIKTHPLRTKEMLDKTCFADISEWALYHHERVDGNGYYGLESEAIPLESKIIAIADAYSALRAGRIYRAPEGHAETIAQIQQGAGKQFDRNLVECFLRLDEDALDRLFP